MRTIEWYFPEENSTGDVLVDEFTDSKFGIDKWTSFAREIIQNSLDAASKNEGGKRATVQVKFGVETIKRQDIPGGNRLLDIIEKAKNKATNPSTIKAYEAGINMLKDPQGICCLKISDYNTTGVATGRDEDWGALVYDEGRSVKHRPGSAGSHGVGKKAPFIMSSVNTVFYTTFNEGGDILAEGKTSLVNWDENGKTYGNKGWYGVYNSEETDRRLKVSPLNLRTDLDNSDYNPYFVRREKQGTDVIVIGINRTDLQAIKKKIINAVLENFFVAIDQKLLEVNVMGQLITAESFERTLALYYETTQKNLKRENDGLLLSGNLLDYYRVYANDPEVIPIEYKDKKYGYLNIYFDTENQKGKKYYCIFRDHGMKIQDVSVTADQPFTCVVVIKDYQDDDLPVAERLNSRMGSVENAAHDDFVIDDNEYQYDPITVALVREVYSKINAFIEEKTTIKALDETPLEGLGEMMTIRGSLSPSFHEEKPKIKIGKSKMKKNGKGQRAANYEQGVTGVGGISNKHHPGVGENKPARPGDKCKATLFFDFAFEPRFFHIGNEFILEIKTTQDVAKANLKIFPISVDGSVANIDNIISSAKTIDGTPLKVSNGTIQGVSLSKDESFMVRIFLLDNFNYSLGCEVYEVKGGEQE